MHWMELTEPELREYVIKNKYPAFRGTQIFEAIHGQRKSLYEASNIPSKLKDALPKPLSSVKIIKVFESKLDATKKLLYELEDGELIEGVLMEYEHGHSLCVSTQVGCRMGCRFCASTQGGKLRDLTVYEMLSQIYAVEDFFNVNISNIILMGSGEPFDNYDNVMQFLRVLHDPKGKGMSYRNMTISTCGIIPGILKFSQEEIPVTLAISLHQSHQEEREKIMPIAKKYPLDQLMSALKVYQDMTNQRITFEYTVIENVNDGREDVESLKHLLNGLKAHINLIPLNPTDHYREKRPDRDKIYAFQNQLIKEGLNATVRRELGADIDASCGQLRAGYSNGIKGVVK